MKILRGIESIGSAISPRRFRHELHQARRAFFGHRHGVVSRFRNDHGMYQRTFQSVGLGDFFDDGAILNFQTRRRPPIARSDSRFLVIGFIRHCKWNVAFIRRHVAEVHDASFVGKPVDIRVGRRCQAECQHSRKCECMGREKFHDYFWRRSVFIPRFPFLRSIILMFTSIYSPINHYFLLYISQWEREIFLSKYPGSRESDCVTRELTFA